MFRRLMTRSPAADACPHGTSPAQRLPARRPARRCALRARTLRALADLALLALALGAAGCSLKGADNVNEITGKRQFVAKCGSCHILARAGTKGIVGPNLDEAFRQGLSEGEARSTVREHWSWEGVARGVIAAAQGQLEALHEPAGPDAGQRGEGRGAGTLG